nr:hypothetical protein [Tanacetum cinerariifolium]
ILRVPQPAAAWRQAGAGRRLGAHRVRAVDEDAGAAVLRPDQRATVVPRSGGVRVRCGQGRLQPVAQRAPGNGHAAGRTGDQQRRSSSQGEQ